MSELNGTYRARAREWAFGMSKSGTPYIAVAFEILEESADGHRITWYGYLSEKPSKRTMEAMRYCGWDNDDVTAPTGLNANEVELVIKPETYEGKTHSKVQWVNRVGGLGLKVDEVDEAQRRAIAASMKSAAVASRSGMPQKSAKPAPAPAAPVGVGPVEGEDVPF